MARKAIHRRLPPKTAPPPPNPVLRQPVNLAEPAKPSARFAEAAGETAAECAAICCCCPCGLLNLLVLTVVRLPAGLCRNALRKQRIKRRAVAGGKKKAGLLGPRELPSDQEFAAGMRPTVVTGEAWPAPAPAPFPPAEAAEREMEMWAKFYSTGFWRSPSQREEP